MGFFFLETSNFISRLDFGLITFGMLNHIILEPKSGVGGLNQRAEASWGVSTGTVGVKPRQ